MVSLFYKFIFYKFFFDISGLFSVIPGFSIPGFSIPAFSTTPSQLRGSLSLLFFIRSTYCMYDLYHIHIWYKTSPPISPSVKAAV